MYRVSCHLKMYVYSFFMKVIVLGYVNEPEQYAS